MMLGTDPYVLTGDQVIALAENAQHYGFPVQIDLVWLLHRINLDSIHVAVPVETYPRDGSHRTPDHRLHFFMREKGHEISIAEFVLDVSHRDTEYLFTSSDYYILQRSLEARKRVAT